MPTSWKRWTTAFVFLLIPPSFALGSQITLHWNWDGGTEEGWVGYDNDTQLSIEPGRNGTQGLGAVNGPPYVSALFPILEIAQQPITPGGPVGFASGNNLPLIGDFYVDTNRRLDGPGNYVSVWIYNKFGNAQYVSYPYDGQGNIEDLGDGWFRHHLANRNRSAGAPIGQAVGQSSDIRLEWNYNFDASTVPIVFDNLTIDSLVPEPTSVWLLASGCLLGLFNASRRRSCVVAPNP